MLTWVLLALTSRTSSLLLSEYTDVGPEPGSDEVLVERADTISPVLKFAVCLDGRTPAHRKTAVEPAAMPIPSKHWPTLPTRSTSTTGGGRRRVQPGGLRSRTNAALQRLR